MLSSEDWQEWQDHPVTQAFLTILRDKHQECQRANGQIKPTIEDYWQRAFEAQAIDFIFTLIEMQQRKDTHG